MWQLRWTEHEHRMQDTLLQDAQSQLQYFRRVVRDSGKESVH